MFEKTSESPGLWGYTRLWDTRPTPIAMRALLTAILENDRPAASQLLAADPGLATRFIEKPQLFRAQIFHSVYAGDTALHLAAAGYRVEIVRLLLAAGADPNSSEVEK